LPQTSITSSPTFRARLLHSEIRRAWLMVGVWSIALATVLIRRAIHGAVMGVDALFYTSVGLLVCAIAVELIAVGYCKARHRSTGALPRWYPHASAAFELAIVLAALTTLEVLSPRGHGAALSAPALLGLPLVTMMSILRLKPNVCLGVGLTGAVCHAGLAIYAIRASDIDTHLWPVLFSYAMWLALIAVGAAMIAHHARRSVIEAVEDSHAAERTERALALVERDMVVAQEIQAGLMPSGAPTIAGYDIAGMARAATKAGGDFYDWQPMADGRLVVALADVTGHGIGPALVMAVCRSYARAAAPATPDPAALIERINRLIYEDLSRTGRFITMALAILQPDGSVELVSAGHGPTLLYRAATGEVEVFGGDGLPLGVMEEETYGPATRFRMERGDVLMLATDGFMEWPRAGDGEMFGVKGLTTTLKAIAGESARGILDRMDAAVLEFVRGAEQQDDTTAVVVKRVV
jgi:serine phosphatase RsbU (regulator of sigma subunit)